MRKPHGSRAQKTILAAALLLWGASVASAQPASGPWPSVHHDRQNTARSDDHNGPQGPNPVIAWENKYSFGRTGGTVDEDGNVYAGNGRQPITKLDGDTGEVIWHSHEGVFLGQCDKSTPSLTAGGRVHMGERGNNMLYVDAETGELLLKSKFKVDGDVRTSPLSLDNGDIIGASGALGNGLTARLKADAPDTPEDPYVWRNSLRKTILNVVPALSNDGNHVYWGIDRRIVVKQDVETGEEVWRVAPTKRGAGGSVADHSVTIGPDETVYFHGRDGLFALDPADGEVLWSYGIAARDKIQSHPALAADGRLYVGVSSKNAYVAAIRPDGELDWEYPMGRRGNFVNNSGVIGADGTFYVTFRRLLMAFEPDGIDHDSNPSTPDRGVLKWSMVFDRTFKNPLAIGGDGVLYAVNGKSVFKIVDPD